VSPSATDAAGHPSAFGDRRMATLGPDHTP